MISKIFKSYIPSISYLFKDGVQAAFINGRYTTSEQKRIDELTEEVNSGHPHIYIDKLEHEIDSEALSPLEVIKKEAYEKALADLKASQNVDAGNSTNSNFAQSLANTNTLAKGSVGESTGDNAPESSGEVKSANPVSAKLAELLPKTHK